MRIWVYNENMIRKIFRTGHSLAITVSKKALNQLGWNEGDSVDVLADGQKGQIVVKKKNKDSQLSLDLHSRPRLGSKIKG